MRSDLTTMSPTEIQRLEAMQRLDAGSVDQRDVAQQLGISQHDVANNLLLTLSGSGQIAPTFWLNFETGLQYPLVSQAPQYRMRTLQDLQNMPVTNSTGQQQILGGLATITRGMGPAVVPLLLRDLETKRRHWFAALAAITGADPVSAEDAGNIPRMAEAWLHWGSGRPTISDKKRQKDTNPLA